ncbi:hypothetical protein VNO80_15151 [Phaseolus coccineus]|uniref:Uncharacterized protein n=1 Tax=Phaseolus coccineus TaxID=3886 RepID=A0AAN9MK38_PHACN
MHGESAIPDQAFVVVFTQDGGARRLQILTLTLQTAKRLDALFVETRVVLLLVWFCQTANMKFQEEIVVGWRKVRFYCISFCYLNNLCFVLSVVESEVC